MLRVYALAIVMVALELRALALAARDFPAVTLATPARAAPYMPPPPLFPLLEHVIGAFRSSMGSFGSSG